MIGFCTGQEHVEVKKKLHFCRFTLHIGQNDNETPLYAVAKNLGYFNMLLPTTEMIGFCNDQAMEHDQ
jgi:hypothetical protein